MVFFNGKSNAGGAERMVLYLDEYLQSRGIETEILDEQFLLNTPGGRLFKKIFRYRHFAKRKPIYMARFTSAYLYTRARRGQIVISNGESTPFFPVDYVISQGCYHSMEKAYGRATDTMSRIAKLQQRGLKMAKHIITVTKSVKEDLIKTYQLPPEKISIASNRVDTDYFPALPKNNPGVRTLVYAGRLENGKGLEVILKAAQIIEGSERWNLLIGCNNPGNTELFKDFEKTEIKIGLQLQNINEELYSRGDIIIFPSFYESFGMVTIEALSAGRPVIATATGIIPELLERRFPGVYLLPDVEEGKFLNDLEKMISEFEHNVDLQQLHQLIREEYGIASYRRRLDEVMILN